MFGMTKDIGIDLGTANTLVYMRGKGIIIREPSVVAVDKKLQCVRYVGQEAKDVIGRTPGSIVAVRPLKDGVIADFDMTSSMLEQFIKKALRGRGKARVIICIPSGVTEVERRAVKEAAQNAGAKRVSIAVIAVLLVVQYFGFTRLYIDNKSSLNYHRVYLKTHDVTGSEGFLRCARHFFAGILTYFKEK